MNDRFTVQGAERETLTGCEIQRAVRIVLVGVKRDVGDLSREIRLIFRVARVRSRFHRTRTNDGGVALFEIRMARTDGRHEATRTDRERLFIDAHIQ